MEKGWKRVGKGGERGWGKEGERKWGEKGGKEKGGRKGRKRGRKGKKGEKGVGERTEDWAPLPRVFHNTKRVRIDET